MAVRLPSSMLNGATRRTFLKTAAPSPFASATTSRTTASTSRRFASRQYTTCFANRPQCLQQSSFPSHRAFSTTPRAAFKTVQQAKSAHSTGPFSWKAAVVFLVTGACMIVYFKYEKERLERKRVAEMSKGVGKPKVGGPFALMDLDGKIFTEEDLKGKYSLVYFGFTHCPDICPDELDKMAAVIDTVRDRAGAVMRPVFITCDPARDTPEVLRKYLAEFHTGLIGLTGTYEAVKSVCKMYRVYFSTPKDVKPGEDYLVDHSIYFYLMDPEGDFVECIGRQDTPESASKVILDHVNDWKRQGKLLDTSEE